MKFRNYCLVLMGKNFTKDIVVHEITKISEVKPNFIDAVGIMIVTFTSVLEISELEETFKSVGWNFLVFDINAKSSAVNFLNSDLHEGLFGFLRHSKQDALDDMSARLMHDIAMSSSTEGQWSPPKQTPKKIKKEELLTEEDVNNMTKDQRQKKLDEYIDFGKRNGFEKLTDLDKKIMELLAK